MCYKKLHNEEGSCPIIVCSMQDCVIGQLQPMLAEIFMLCHLMSGCLCTLIVVICVSNVYSADPGMAGNSEMKCDVPGGRREARRSLGQSQM
jgi:hypothetical protein